MGEEPGTMWTAEPRVIRFRVPFPSVLALVFKAVMALLIVLVPLYLVAFVIWALATGH